MDLTEKQITYFWERVDMSGGPDACWDWTCGCADNGYGIVVYNYKNWGTHNLALRLTAGPPPPDKTYALHSCTQNRKCSNPVHLRWGDAADNGGDRVEQGTLLHGISNGSSKLTDAQVLKIREKYEAGNGQELADEYGVSRQTIRRIVKRINWKHI